uniref:hypothetical protein n=1 Tax=Ningiella ruwaisensis TaxID=2364274 RepID=UPI00109F4DAD|nr:hypothetical protein [Ningiella ruwaisensis]
MGTLQAKQIVLSSSPIHDEFKIAEQMLEEAYAQVGHTLRYQDLPYTRSIVSANVGVIDGLSLRLEQHTQNYPNLIRINVALLNSKTLVVINKKLCPNCDIGKLRSIGAVSGFEFPESKLQLEDNTNLKIELAEHHRLFTFFEAGRVNAIVTSNLFLPDRLRDTQKYRYVQIAEQDVYHFVHKQHQALAKQLDVALSQIKLDYANQLKQSGPAETEELPQRGPVNDFKPLMQQLSTNLSIVSD